MTPQYVFAGHLLRVMELADKNVPKLAHKMAAHVLEQAAKRQRRLPPVANAPPTVLLAPPAPSASAWEEVAKAEEAAPSRPSVPLASTSAMDTKLAAIAPSSLGHRPAVRRLTQLGIVCLCPGAKQQQTKQAGRVHHSNSCAYDIGYQRLTKGKM